MSKRSRAGESVEESEVRGDATWEKNSRLWRVKLLEDYVEMASKRGPSSSIGAGSLLDPQSGPQRISRTIQGGTILAPGKCGLCWLSDVIAWSKAEHGCEMTSAGKMLKRGKATVEDDLAM
ncbi:hypothetical protein HAX54_025047 [Datura stramonium]|uniref:Uncharacterized protein n=1 Tax=Datura stramonium TaxID=4076 RepID=A0ABS8UZM0_DATST|nr:hypothetical protein [Datura stramonium]